jgi:proteasome beta subunit
VTVVLSLLCSNGIVIASDSQITEGDRAVSYPAPKLHPLGEGAAWGGSGARSVLLDLESEFDASAGAILQAPDVGHALQAKVLPILRHHYDNYIAEVPGEEGSGGPSAYVLAAGYDGEGRPFIVEINPHGMVSRYEDIGFHAIGSGAPMAQQAGVLLAHFRMTERDVDYGVVAAVRVLEALELTSPSVGDPFSVARITPDGAEHLDEDAIADAHERSLRWQELEQRALDDLFD